MSRVVIGPDPEVVKTGGEIDGEPEQQHKRGDEDALPIDAPCLLANFNPSLSINQFLSLCRYDHGVD